jgi:hypothetical protein
VLARGAGEIAEVDGEESVRKVAGALAVDGVVGMEELVGDVGKHGSAAGGDAAFGDENEEVGEEKFYIEGGIEFGELGEEVEGEVFGVGLHRSWLGVTETETGLGVQDAMTTLATVDGEMTAAGVILREWQRATKNEGRGLQNGKSKTDRYESWDLVRLGH